MDLPTCPACGQSVLDDDAEDCPFCGASLSGKPGSKPAPAKKPAAAKQGAQKTSSATKKKKPAAGKSDDDPFDLEGTEQKKAIRLLPKPIKGRTHKVVCPMCETAGYTSTKAAGKDVRCANPECLVPVFTAPEIEEEEEPAEQPPPKKSMAMLVGISLVGVVLVLGGVWLYLDFSSNPGPSPLPPVNPDGGPTIVVDPSDDPDLPDQIDNENGPPDQPHENGDDQTTGTVTAADRIQQTLQLMVDTSEDQSDNRKSVSIRLTADAYAVNGNLDGARSELDRLADVFSDIPYYQVPPLVTIAFHDIQAGRADEAKAAVEDALQAAKLPARGRDRSDVATLLAAALVAVGRDDQAAEYFDASGRLEGADAYQMEFGQFWSDILVVRALETYDVTDPDSLLPRAPWSTPQWTAATLVLAGQDQWDAALRWAERHPEVEGRSESVVAWAEALTARPSGVPDAGQKIASAGQKLPPAGQARLFARVAAQQWIAGHKNEAAQSLDQAVSKLDSLPKPVPLVLPELAQLYRLELPDPEPFRMAALAAADVSRLQAQMGQTDEAWQSLTLAVDNLRAMAPSPSAVADRNNVDGTVLRAQLRDALELESQGKVTLAYANYKKRLNSLAAAARRRFRLQESLFVHATEHDGLHPQIWEEIQLRTTDPELKEPYYNTTVPWFVWEQFERNGPAEQASAVQAAIEAATDSEDTPPEWGLERYTRLSFEAGKPLQAIERIENDSKDASNRISELWRDRWLVESATMLLNSAGAEDAFLYVKEFDDPFLRADTLDLLAALATSRGEGDMVRQSLADLSFDPTDKVAVCHGFVVGLKDTK